jgi:hypothetical protein
MSDVLTRLPDEMLPRRPSRFDWLHASWLLSCTVAGFVGLFFLPRDTPLAARFAVALGIGACGALALMRFMQVVRDEHLWRMCRHLPRSISIDRQLDGTMVAFVETLEGEPKVLELPDDYDPREDEGRRLFELLGVKLP